MTRLLRFPIGRTVAVSVLCLTVLSGGLSAQLQAPKQPPRSIKIFALRQVDAASAAALLQQLFRDMEEKKMVSIGVDAASNSIIVSASDKEALESIEAVLLKLDQTPVAKPDKKVELTVYYLKFVAASEVQKTLRALLGPDDRIAVDPRTNALLVSGTAATRKQIEQLLKMVDAPPPRAENLRVRIVWLVNAKLISEEASAPPKDLAKVIEELKKTLDIGELKLAAQTLVNVSGGGTGERQQFSTRGSAELDGPIELTIEGDVSGKTEGNPQLSIRIEARTVDQTLCYIQTQISAPAGHPIVLGVTTINSLESMFVVQVLPNPKETVKPVRNNPLRKTPGGGFGGRKR